MMPTSLSISFHFTNFPLIPTSRKTMRFDFIPNSVLQRLPVLLYAATWTTILTVTVAVASFTPEMAFVSAVNPTSSLSLACAASVRLPLDVPSHNFCFPPSLFKRSGIDIFVPPIFAAAIVASSACVVKAMGLWEAEDNHI
ncbi:uncharacterized protein LOC130997585 [Salvia miltiorrhiza]|uniref:uncharacterized protein LOC130997585 n=1 Tax=Salvia miltiorrhiza TaxID=226208 RepID=UPI0025ACB1E8|nr:uncharacterized protein LOC130997585 [Salvia miltiorrhiza]